MRRQIAHGGERAWRHGSLEALELQRVTEQSGNRGRDLDPDPPALEIPFGFQVVNALPGKLHSLHAMGSHHEVCASQDVQVRNMRAINQA